MSGIATSIDTRVVTRAKQLLIHDEDGFFAENLSVAELQQCQGVGDLADLAADDLTEDERDAFVAAPSAHVRRVDVPPGPLVIYTDVFSYLRTRRDRHAEFADLIDGHVLTVSFATYAEVLAGGYNANLGPRRMEQLRQALSGFVVLPYSRAVVEVWAPLHAKLYGQLHNGGANDLWTAACALVQSPPLPVVTNNLNDFRAVA